MLRQPQPEPVQSAAQQKALAQASLQQYWKPQDKPSSTHQQLPQKPCQAQGKGELATGVLADDCIDLLSQPEQPHEAAAAAAAATSHIDTGGHTAMAPHHDNHADSCAHGNAADMQEDYPGHDSGPLGELMTCSTNLLNAGIRVHKYCSLSVTQLLCDSRC